MLLTRSSSRMCYQQFFSGLGTDLFESRAKVTRNAWLHITFGWLLSTLVTGVTSGLIKNP
jgi:hypothetical protein